MAGSKKYDVVIIGSGLGGLLCANLLAMRGMKVCLLEKNRQFGGNLQTFSRDKQIFDTGVHYIGGLEKGQTLYQLFKYVGLMGHLKVEKMDECFDKVLIEDDDKVYCQSQGYEAFQNHLIKAFPEEKDGIISYCLKIKDICSSFPLYNLYLKPQTDELYKGNNESAASVIAFYTQNEKLQAVLAGNNLLYAGDIDTTPFHVHALIVNSYIESSWKCIGGGSQIAKILVAAIRKNGGEIFRNNAVTAIKEDEGKITHVLTEDGQQVAADYFISNVHPATTIGLTQSSLLKGLYRKRINGLPQTVSSFSLHIVLEKETVPFENCNYYFHKEGQVWQINHYTKENWPLGYGLYFTEDKLHPGFSATVSVLTPMRYEEVSEWANTYNRVGRESSRGRAYEQFKEDKARTLLGLIAKRFPLVTDNIKSFYISTPLSNRDYIGDAEGSMYGIQKDYHDPLQTMISPRTKIPNLFLTGQNLNLHGILGTSLSAVLTCVMLTGDEGLVDRIREA
ncbi:NAD(P)/FAD-dependent oxidoreductase [Niabella yanshanensis]|uniref:NAD(P)/FAD-dependent oxidoreductase n=1 Tax=Niabella yanshanensis TaxID=577386 RepID=A0ABZ0W3A3_9BACT|nr:NAD(P)/FAD-dependent oxidoreductase [Niabella yanshanensis]WQD36490.1 NAD(P)/FAD-dependent oxidoreductase [Niabella yanshanensis]